VSDHCPLILSLNVQTHKKRCFHFESYWPKLPGFLEAVSHNWNAPVSTACPVEGIFIKLLRLSNGLQKWSHHKVGNVKLQLAIAKEILHRLEIARDNRVFSPGEEWLRKKIETALTRNGIIRAHYCEAPLAFCIYKRVMQILLSFISKPATARKRTLLQNFRLRNILSPHKKKNSKQPWIFMITC
jgi:hypothetical protein